LSHDITLSVVAPFTKQLKNYENFDKNIYTIPNDKAFLALKNDHNKFCKCHLSF